MAEQLDNTEGNPKPWEQMSLKERDEATQAIHDYFSRLYTRLNEEFSIGDQEVVDGFVNWATQEFRWRQDNPEEARLRDEEAERYSKQVDQEIEEKGIHQYVQDELKRWELDPLNPKNRKV